MNPIDPMVGKSALLINSVMRNLVKKGAIQDGHEDTVREALLDYAFAATIDSDIRREVHFLNGVDDE